MSARTRKRLVTAKAESLVRQYLLRMLEEPGASLDGFERLVGDVREAGSELPLALANAMDDESPRIRIGAAWLIRENGKSFPYLVADKDTIKDTERVLLSALKSRDADESLTAAIVLSLGNVPDAAIPILRRKMRNGLAHVQVFCAAALSSTETEIAEAIQVLSRGLTHDDESVRFSAAFAFGRLGMRPPAIQHVVDLLRRASDSFALAILFGLKQAGPRAKLAVPAIIELIGRSDISPVVRRLALAVLGSVTGETDEAYSVLKERLLSSDCDLVQGAAEGLALTDALPEGIVVRLAQRLTEDRAEMRWAVANGLKILGPRAVEAVPMLVEQARRETDVAVYGMISVALEAIGTGAIPQLIEILTSDDAKSVDIAGVTLLEMGAESAAAIGRFCLSERDARVHMIGLELLRRMGPAATAAVPALAMMLDETDDDKVAVQIIATIHGCGPAARAATAALVRCVAERGTDAAEWAQTALRGIGQSAIPEVTAASATASGDGARRLEELLAELRPAAEARFARLALVERDLLETFVVVARILDKFGPTSWRGIAEIIRGLPAGAASPTYGLKRASANTLAGKIRKLGATLGVQLTEHQENRKGDLSKDGRDLWPTVQDYLRAYGQDQAHSAE